MFKFKKYDYDELIDDVADDNWVPFFEEFAQKLANMTSAPMSIKALADDMKANGIPVINLSDFDTGGAKKDFEELDPFSLMACVTHANLDDEQRISSCTFIKSKLNISATVPKGFRGLAKADGKGLFIPYATERKEEDMFALCDLFKEAVEKSYVSDENLERIRQVKDVGLRITVGLSWIKPNLYVPYDYVLRTFCKIGTMVFTPLNVENMQYATDKVKSKFNPNFPAVYLLSRNTYEGALSKKANEEAKNKKSY